MIFERARKNTPMTTTHTEDSKAYELRQKQYVSNFDQHSQTDSENVFFSELKHIGTFIKVSGNYEHKQYFFFVSSQNKPRNMDAGQLHRFPKY